MHYRESFSCNLHIRAVRVIINKKKEQNTVMCKRRMKAFFSIELPVAQKSKPKELHTAGTTVDQDVKNLKGVEAEIEQFGCSH